MHVCFDTSLKKMLAECGIYFKSINASILIVKSLIIVKSLNDVFSYINRDSYIKS